MLPTVRTALDAASPTDERFRYGEPAFATWHPSDRYGAEDAAPRRGAFGGTAIVALVALACVGLVVGYEASVGASSAGARTPPAAAVGAMTDAAVGAPLGSNGTDADAHAANSLGDADELSLPPNSPPSPPPMLPPQHVPFRERHAAWLAATKAALDMASSVSAGGGAGS